MEQKRAPEPNPMQETISPVFPRRRLGNADCDGLAPSAPSVVPSAIRAAMLFKKPRRDQYDFMSAPSVRSLHLIPKDTRLAQKQGTGETSLFKLSGFPTMILAKKRGPNIWGLFHGYFQEYDD